MSCILTNTTQIRYTAYRTSEENQEGLGEIPDLESDSAGASYGISSFFGLNSEWDKSRKRCGRLRLSEAEKNRN